jgi:hypothetical protein
MQSTTAITNTRPDKLSRESPQPTFSIETRVVSQRNTRRERVRPPALWSRNLKKQSNAAFSARLKVARAIPANAQQS